MAEQPYEEMSSPCLADAHTYSHTHRHDLSQQPKGNHTPQQSINTVNNLYVHVHNLNVFRQFVKLCLPLLMQEGSWNPKSTQSHSLTAVAPDRYWVELATETKGRGREKSFHTCDMLLWKMLHPVLLAPVTWFWISPIHMLDAAADS